MPQSNAEAHDHREVDPMTDPNPPTQPLPEWQPQPQPTEPKPKTRRWPWIAGIVGAFLIGLLIGAAGGGDSTDSTTATPGTTATVTATVTASAEPASAPTVTKTTTVKVTPVPKAEITEGVWVVGTDIKAGTYRTIEAVSDGCYWEIDRKPGSDDIVQNDNPTGGRPTVNLRDGQQFITNDCGDWART
jgi:hypothetical protein